MAHATDVADYIIRSIPVDPLKLQKLLFYTQAVSLVKFNVPAFEDRIEAWDYGPVVRTVYDKYKNSNEVITPPEASATCLDLNTITSADLVIDYYGKMIGPALINETHSESPWRDAYSRAQNSVISNEVMKEYYSKIFSFD